MLQKLYYDGNASKATMLQRRASESRNVLQEKYHCLIW
jgi:hypothetical protein